MSERAQALRDSLGEVGPAQMVMYSRMRSGEYAQAARVIDLCMALGGRRCVGDGCDEGRPCRRHARTLELAHRYARWMDRRKRGGV